LKTRCWMVLKRSLKILGILIAQSSVPWVLCCNH
jgi:hypothetical protein